MHLASPARRSTPPNITAGFFCRRCVAMSPTCRVQTPNLGLVWEPQRKMVHAWLMWYNCIILVDKQSKIRCWYIQKTCELNFKRIQRLQPLPTDLVVGNVYALAPFNWTNQDVLDGNFEGQPILVQNPVGIPLSMWYVDFASIMQALGSRTIFDCSTSQRTKPASWGLGGWGERYLYYNIYNNHVGFDNTLPWSWIGIWYTALGPWHHQPLDLPKVPALPFCPYHRLAEGSGKTYSGLAISWHSIVLKTIRMDKREYHGNIISHHQTTEHDRITNLKINTDPSYKDKYMDYKMVIIYITILESIYLFLSSMW